MPTPSQSAQAPPAPPTATATVPPIDYVWDPWTPGFKQSLIVDPGQKINFLFLKKHNIVEVFSKPDFDNCNFANGRIVSGNTASVTAETEDSSYTYVAPRTTGTVFLVCGVGSHCRGGGGKHAEQKVAIIIEESVVWQQLITLKLDSSEPFADRQSAFIEALAERYQHPVENVEVVAVNGARRGAASRGASDARSSDVDLMIWGPSAKALSLRLQQDLQRTQLVLDQFTVRTINLPGRPISALQFGANYTFDCSTCCQTCEGCEVRPRGSGIFPAAISLLSCQRQIVTLNFTNVPAFRGKIPQTILNLRSLRFLWIIKTSFSGTLPPLPLSLERIRIADVNLSGTFPQETNHIRSLKGLYIENANFTGPLPEVGNLTSLDFLYISNVRFSGPLTSSLADLSALADLTIQNTAISGRLPEKFGGAHYFKILNLRENLFTGLLPASLFHSPAVEEFNLPWEAYNLFPQKCPTNKEHRVGVNYSLARFGEPRPMANFGHCELNPVCHLFHSPKACGALCMRTPCVARSDARRSLALIRGSLGMFSICTQPSRYAIRVCPQT
jgi:hypothetical protein